jgi:large subunit ribosomal protein L16
MLTPKKISHRKMHRFDSNIKQKRTSNIIRGNFGLKTLSCSRLTSQQLDSAQKTMRKKMHRFGKILLRISPNLSITEKPSDVRMGKGKGNITHWCYPIKVGQIIFEFQGVSRHIAREVSRLCTSKLSVKTKFILTKQKN